MDWIDRFFIAIWFMALAFILLNTGNKLDKLEYAIKIECVAKK